MGRSRGLAVRSASVRCGRCAFFLLSSERQEGLAFPSTRGEVPGHLRILALYLLFREPGPLR